MTTFLINSNLVRLDMKTYNQGRFRKVLHNGVSKPMKKDNSDMLVYLIYVNYMRSLLEEGSSPANGSAGDDGEITKERLERGHGRLMKAYRG